MLNFWDLKKIFYDDKKWLEIIGLYEKLYIIIGIMKLSVNFYKLKKKNLIEGNDWKWLDCMKSCA